MQRLWELLRRRPGDAIVLAYAIFALTEIWIRQFEGRLPILVAGALLWTLPLLLRERFPLAVPFFVVAVAIGEMYLVDASSYIDGAVGFVLLVGVPFVLGAYNRPFPAVAGALAFFATMPLVIVKQDDGAWIDLVWISGITTASLLAGLALNRRSRHAAEHERRAARLELEQEEEARAAVAEERSRIARELHDVIAHSISVMTVQAGAARMLLDEQPARALEPVAAVEETGRQALAELRRLLGVLRMDMASEPVLAPQPGIAHLDSLLEHARGAGMSVELAVEGEPEQLPPGVDLAAYRVVQEALTNAIKHAGPTSVWVAIRYGKGELDVEVTNDGNDTGGGGGIGQGLVGMRERVALYGVELEAGRLDAGSYRVRARLPLGSDR